MSHFTVMVIGADFEKALAPFHTFECTGTDDEYVVDVDETAEVIQQWEERTETRFKDPDGSLHLPSDDRFFIDPPEGMKLFGSGWSEGVLHISKDWEDGKGRRAKIRQLPEGWAEVTIHTRDHIPFQEWVRSYYSERPALKEPYSPKTDADSEKAGKYGYLIEDENGLITKVIDRTNPKAKWDWYRVGGRWSNMLTLKDGSKANRALKKDIDWDNMRNAAEARAAQHYDAVAAARGGLSWTPWRVLLEEHGKENLDVAREAYHSQPAFIKASSPDENVDLGMSREEYDDLVRWGGLDDFLVARGKYLNDARCGAGVTFALLREGDWYERGEMGWWGCVSNEKDGPTWNEEFARLVDSLDDEDMITIVDCHV